LTAKLLVVATAPDPEDELRERLRRFREEDAEVLVIAPASDLSLLQWLTSDEDRARADAERKAQRAARAVGAAEAIVGDADPVIAIEDALRVFPANELIVVTRPEDEATWLERDVLDGIENYFGLPVTHLIDDDVGHGEASHRSERAARPEVSRWETFARNIARGENPFTAFRAQFAVAVAVGVVAFIFIAIAWFVYTR
jgi:hypothetical protein